MWCALFKKVKNTPDNDKYTPLQGAIGVFKHFQQYNYNKSKWGLDKNTEFAELVLCEGLKICFEALYIIRMIDGIAVTTWRVSEARFVKSFIALYAQKHNGEQPSVKQIRSWIHNSHRKSDGAKSLVDFVYQLGADLLKYVGSQSFQRTDRLRQHIPTRADESVTTDGIDADLFQKMNSEIAKGKWPLNYNPLHKFHQDKIGLAFVQAAPH
jgi:hypothetical protein